MQAEQSSDLLIENPRPFIVRLTFNRPNRSNAFNTELARGLMTYFEALSLDSKDTRCIILTGAGQRAFCAGADLKERDGMSDHDWERQHLVFERMIRAIVNCPIPIIAAVNGAAYAGGCEIACATDFIYAADTAAFAQTETRIGIIPGAGGTQTLSRAIGERRAKELILSAEPFSAIDAQAWGLVNALFSPEELQEGALRKAELIAANAPIAVRQAKQAIYRGGQMSLSDGLAFEIEAYNRTVQSEDRREGVRAFNEKRAPDFKGK